ncbi:MAG: hypothetical protein LBQ60_14850 [Bacteroidales bacterium]|nr:hypothetical protein [Bacteroidales bacterium]
MKKTSLLFILFFAVSCAKEIYTDEDAASAKREAQKVGLTVMVRDINQPLADMSGFTISSSQCGTNINSITSTDGMADLMMIKGEAILLIEKDGYPSTIAIVSINPQGTERTNSVVVIPVFPDTHTSESVEGKVTLTSTPVANALVSIDVDMDELIDIAFSGLSGELKKFRPQAIAYSSHELMQPVRTDNQGVFHFKIPVTPAELTYTLRVQETMIEQDSYTGEKVIKTNGQNNRVVDIEITPNGN